MFDYFQASINKFVAITSAKFIKFKYNNSVLLKEQNNLIPMKTSSHLCVTRLRSRQYQIRLESEETHLFRLENPVCGRRAHKRKNADFAVPSTTSSWTRWRAQWRGHRAWLKISQDPKAGESRIWRIPGLRGGIVADHPLPFFLSSARPDSSLLPESSNLLSKRIIKRTMSPPRGRRSLLHAAASLDPLLGHFR
jgi:hypothetical protein